MLTLCCPERKFKLTIVMVKEWHNIVQREMVSVSVDMVYSPTCASTYLVTLGTPPTFLGLVYICKVNVLARWNYSLEYTVTWYQKLLS